MATTPNDYVATQRNKTKERHNSLKQEAKTIVQEHPEDQWMPLLRSAAGELELDLDVKDPELQKLLDDAERGLNPVKVYRGGDRLEATESVFLLDGMVKLGEANVIVGQPKVGKSSFTTGLIAALRDRLPCFLGRDLSAPNQRMPVLIFGTDQSEGDWLHFLKREALVDEAQSLNAQAVDFFCSLESGQDYNFTREGIKAMRSEIDKHQCPLVVIDSLSSMMEATGIEENTARYAQPIRTAIKQLRSTGATLLIIHHSVKRPTTWDWITECRGSSSISSVFSWGVLMRWVAQEDDGLMRTDKRVGFTGKGRGSGESGGVMAEYLAEGGWTYLDGLEQAQQVERVRQRISELGGVRASVFDYLTLRTELGADVSSDEVATELNKSRSNVSRELQNLKAKGLAFVCREEATGARPRPYWRLTKAAEQAVVYSSPGGLSFESSDSFDKEMNKINVFNSQDSTAVPAGMKLIHADFRGSADEFQQLGKEPVELYRNGVWSNGYLIRDGTNPESITVEKIGTPSLTISNLRYGIDVRPCSDPFANSEPEPAAETDFEPEL